MEGEIAVMSFAPPPEHPGEPAGRLD